MEVYTLVRMDRDNGKGQAIVRFKATDFDEAMHMAERIEVFPGIFGDDEVKPTDPAILLLKDEEV